VQRIDSVISQKHNIDQIIVIDDASTDSSLTLLSKYNETNIKIISNSSNSGSAFTQWHKGISLSNNDFLIWIAESDDFCTPEFLEETIKPFSDPDVVLSYSRSIDVNENGEQLGLSYNHLEWCNISFIKDGNSEIFEHLYYNCTIPNISAVVFRRSAVDESFFDHNYKLCGDWYFYLKLLQKGKIAYNSKPLNFHRFHEKTLRNRLKNSDSVLFERLNIIYRIKKDCKVSTLIYYKSAYYQLKQFIFQQKISALFSRKLIQTVYGLIKHNPIFIFILLYTISVRILSRVINSLR
jgi:glycosyltransferase involved in cell wall biosynthesis